MNEPRSPTIAGARRSALPDLMLPTFLRYAQSRGCSYELDSLNGMLELSVPCSRTFRRIYDHRNMADYWYAAPTKSVLT